MLGLSSDNEEKTVVQNEVPVDHQFIKFILSCSKLPPSDIFFREPISDATYMLMLKYSHQGDFSYKYIWWKEPSIVKRPMLNKHENRQVTL